MATIRIPNIDEAGNFTNPEVLDRLRETLGGGSAGVSVEDLPTPFYVAHRGGAKAAPEHTVEAFRIMDATGIDVLEADVQPTGDGALVCFHDATVDRTTDGTGNVTDYSLQSFLSLNASDYMPWPRSAESMTFQQFLTEFGSRRVLMVEPKNAGTLDQMLDAAEAAGVKDSILVETNVLSVAQQAVVRGYTVWFHYGTNLNTTPLQDVLDAGVQHVAAASGNFGASVSDADVQTMLGTGRKVTIYSVDRRFHRDRFLAMGVHGISSDNPTYVKSNTAMQKVDSWRRGVWGHGLATNRAARPPIEDGALILETTGTNVYEVIMPGEVCPIAGTTYTIDVDLGWRTLPTDTTKALQVQFCIGDDQEYNYATKTAAWGYSDCYQLHLRANGQLGLYRLNQYRDGVQAGSVLIGSAVNTPAFLAGEFAHVQIKVTPTQVSIERTDVASTPITYANTDLRGGYINLTRFSDNGVGMFRNLTIS